jgi:hypothetical protein
LYLLDYLTLTTTTTTTTLLRNVDDVLSSAR